MKSRFLKFTLVRHGAKQPKADGQTDNQVELSPAGLEQGRLIGERFVDQPFDIAVHSDVTRTEQMCRAILGERPVPTKGENGLYVTMPDGKTDDLWVLCREVGDVPLSGFDTHAKGVLMAEYGNHAYATLAAAVPNSATNILVVGHAPLLPALARAIIQRSAFAPADLQWINALDMKMADTITLEIGGNGRLKARSHTPYEAPAAE